MAARYNKIFAGPYTQDVPQVQEAIAAAAIMPGTGIVWSSGAFAQAGASTTGKVFVAQDDYLTGKATTDAWPAGDRIIGMEMLDSQFFNVLVPTGVTVAKGTPLTTNGTGRFIIATTGKQVMCFAEEAFANSSGSDQLVRVRAAKGYLSA